MMDDSRMDEALRNCDLSTIAALDEPRTVDSKKQETPRWLRRTIILVGIIVVALTVSVILLATTVEKVFNSGETKSTALDASDSSTSTSPTSSLDSTQTPTLSPKSQTDSIPSFAPETSPPGSSTPSPSRLSAHGEPSVLEQPGSANPSLQIATPVPSPAQSNSPSSTPPEFAAPANPSFKSPVPISTPSSAPPSYSLLQPSKLPSEKSSQAPSEKPSRKPTTSTPTNSATYSPTNPEVMTTFYAIGDVPYNAVQRTQLIQQIANIPADADFVIHVGDIRSARDESDCTLAEYQDIANILKASPVPVFIVLGDNEWNDCANPQQGWDFWHQELQRLESYWGDDFEWVLTDIQRFATRPETFYFVRKGALFIGLNLVGGRILTQSEWSGRLSEQATWTIDLMRNHELPTVIFAHANPLDKHNDYFTPLTTFIQNEWDLPVVYLNGDKHQWMFNSTFYGQPNWYRVMLEGGTRDPPLKFHVNTSSSAQTISQTFSYDRQLL